MKYYTIIQQFEFIVTNYKLSQVLDLIKTIHIDSIGYDFLIKATTDDPDALVSRLSQLSIAFTRNDVIRLTLNAALVKGLVTELLELTNASGQTIGAIE